MMKAIKNKITQHFTHSSETQKNYQKEKYLQAKRQVWLKLDLDHRMMQTNFLSILLETQWLPLF